MPYVERITKTGDTVKRDRYFTPGYKKENSKKATERLRQLLTADEKDLPEINIEFGYKSKKNMTEQEREQIKRENSKKAAAFSRQLLKYYHKGKKTKEVGEMAKIHRTRTMKEIHVEVIITNARGNREILLKLIKALTQMRRLHPMSYVITEVDFQE